MNDQQWNSLLAVLRGELVQPAPIGFIIDCPWIPGWAGLDVVDYLGSETLWFEANRKAIESFPGIWFLPGFWSEFGMCTEPSAFGTRCIFPRNEFPFAEKIIKDIGQIADLKTPNPAKDGLLPFVLVRLRWALPHIEALGHKIRFSVSRGPLNVAAFLMGAPEFLMAIRTDPVSMHQLLRIITDYLKQWHAIQREAFSSIGGMLVLDDIVGFMGENDFLAFGMPYLREIFDADVAVKMFHNDAPCAQSMKHYPDIGINLFNPGIQTSLADMRQLCGNKLTILGNIPPRDVLAQGKPQDVRAAVNNLLDQAKDCSRLILSCGGGMPPGVSTENLQAFIDAVNSYRT